jgi:flagellar hook assembly protein FlgD
VQIDSTGNWNYLVQLSRDSTFSTIICSDSCNTTSIKLNNLSGFERISIGKPIYWRVKVHSGYNKVSEFSKSNFPFNYYPQFAQLESFSGEKKEDGTIDLLWRTVNEYNCAGFNIHRSELVDDNFEKLNENLVTGRSEYSFQDLTSMAGKTYYYKLEEVNIHGKKKFYQTISITAAIPDKFSLTQNYPNPFNTETSFKYEIPTASHVKVEICNVLGRKVKTLVNEKMEAGFYIVYWDGINEQGENVVSGIYFYSLTTNKGKLTRKMVVVR